SQSFHSHEDGERSLGHITHIINNSGIRQPAKKLAIAIFREIAKAEAVVHGKEVEDVYFHEVGAVDSIIDIVGAAICMDLLEVDEVVCSKVHDGQGFVNCQHGRLPIPVPAVAQMLKNSGIAMVIEEVQAELVTPTGLGILKTICHSCGKMPSMEIQALGYGFGKTETGNLNALRVFLGTAPEEDAFKKQDTEEDVVTLLETNVDDCTGEVLGYILERLRNEGALDAYVTPIQMKKNRPAVQLTVLCKEAVANALSEIIFEETGTLGIRICQRQRLILPRDVRVINTEFGPIRAKVSKIKGKDSFKPEFEDCAEIAKKYALSLKEVQDRIRKSISR
ncbi:MAG: nickel pincer cofactor biosynthesis protein LarC, partial [Anaerovorax sp.]